MKRAAWLFGRDGHEGTRDQGDAKDQNDKDQKDESNSCGLRRSLANGVVNRDTLARTMMPMPR